MTVERRRVGLKVKRQTVSLSEKFQDHWRRKKFDPSEATLNIFAIAFVWVNTLSLVLEGFFLLLPHFFTPKISRSETLGDSFYDTEAGYGLFISEVLTVYLAMGTLFQWWFLYDGSLDKVLKSTKDGYFQDGKLPEGWRRCALCKVDAPPRSHHCTVCNICVLKRDHHCYFAGTCVGYHTQRHFLIFLVYAISASIYGVVMQGLYLGYEEGFSYFLPILAMWRTIFSRRRVLHLVLLLHFYISAIVAAGCASFLRWQLRIIPRGQTSYDARVGSIRYCYSGCGGTKLGRTKTVDQCRYENFVYACGTPGEFLLCLFLPMVRTKLKGNGVKWDV